MVFTGIQLSALAIVFALFFAGNSSATATVVLLGNTYSVSVRDIEATFNPAVESTGIRGTLLVAQPLDGCSPLVNKLAKPGEGRRLSFALIKKGNCTYYSKVRNAQAAGFSAAIVYNDEYNHNFYNMSGNSEGITTHAVFISRAAGELLQKYINKYENLECRIIPYRRLDWKMYLYYFIGLLIIYVIVYLADRKQQRRNIMSCEELQALPTLIFTSPGDDKGTSATCAVCLEDYTTGEKLRLLPCHHRFHAICVDFWLTKCRTFCPVCKRDVKTGIKEPPASEQTPLLSSFPLTSIDISASGAASTHSSSSGSWTVHIPSQLLTSSNGDSGAASTHLATSGSWVVHIPSSTSIASHFVSSSNSGSPYLSQSFGSPRQ